MLEEARSEEEKADQLLKVTEITKIELIYEKNFYGFLKALVITFN